MKNFSSIQKIQGHKEHNATPSDTCIKNNLKYHHGACFAAPRTKLSLGKLTAHMVTDLNLGCSASAPDSHECIWKNSRGQPANQTPATHVGYLDGVIVSWVWPGSMLLLWPFRVN